MSGKGAVEDEQERLLRIATLIDDLKHDDITVRINSMRHLREISDALGEDRTRDELLPFLKETVLDDDDEVLLVAAEELATLVPQVGGPESIPSLLKVLEELATHDEPSVRAKAVASFHILVAQMKKDAVNVHFFPIVKRLAERDWYTTRSAACGLFHVGYSMLTEDNKAEFRGMFGNLCKDEVVTVRRAAAENIGKLAQVVDYPIMREELFPLFKTLASDEQDLVRLQTVSNVIAFARLETRQDRKQEVLKTAFLLSEDKAWRVKWTIAHNFVEMAELIIDGGLDIEVPKFVRLFVMMLADDEAEVRAAAVTNMVKVGRIFAKSTSHPTSFADSALAQLPDIVEDQVEFVRTAAASVILGMSPIVGKDKTIDQILPLFLLLLKDHFPQVRLNVIGTLDAMEGMIPVSEMLESLLPSITELSSDSNWRIRHAVIQKVPLIAKHLGEQFDDELVRLSLVWLLDEVFTIRQAATENLQKLTELFGEKWAKLNVFGKIEELSQHNCYLLRMQAIRGIEALSTVVSVDLVTKELLPMLLTLAKDGTANIKFNVAKAVTKMASRIAPAAMEKEVKPVLEQLLEEKDNDVKYFAQQTLDGLQRKKN